MVKIWNNKISIIRKSSWGEGEEGFFEIRPLAQIRNSTIHENSKYVHSQIIEILIIDDYSKFRYFQDKDMWTKSKKCENSKIIIWKNQGPPGDPNNPF